MRKQFTYLVAALALSATLIGCSSKQEEVVTTPSTEVEATVPTETPATEENVADTEVIENETATENTEVPAETPAADATQKNESTTQEDTQKETTDKVETKPSTPPSTTNKPSTSTKPNTTTKPSTSSKPSSKPTASAKPEATTKPGASTKPEVTTKPETSAKPEATTKPEASAKPETTSLSASEVFDKTIAGIELPMTMEMDSTMIADMYGIDTSILKSFKVVAPVMSAHITEIGIFEVKDAAGIDAVKAGITQRTGGINPQFLYPSLQEAFANRQTVVKGNYVFFAMDQNIDTLVANFNNAVK